MIQVELNGCRLEQETGVIHDITVLNGLLNPKAAGQKLWIMKSFVVLSNVFNDSQVLVQAYQSWGMSNVMYVLYNIIQAFCSYSDIFSETESTVKKAAKKLCSWSKMGALRGSKRSSESTLAVLRFSKYRAITCLRKEFGERRVR